MLHLEIDSLTLIGKFCFDVISILYHQKGSFDEFVLDNMYRFCLPMAKEADKEKIIKCKSLLALAIRQLTHAQFW